MPLPTPSADLQQAQDIVTALRAGYMAFASGNMMVQSYQIQGRQMQYRDSGEILKALNYWEGQVARLKAAERIAPPQRIYMRF